MATYRSEQRMLGALGCAISLSALAISSQAHATDDRPQSVADAKDALKPFDLAYIGADDDRHSDRNGSPRTTSRMDSTALQLSIIAAELKAQRELIAKQNEIIARQQLAIDMLSQRQMASSEIGRAHV